MSEENGTTYRDYGYDPFLQKPLKKPNRPYSSSEFSSMIEPHSITEDLIDQALIDRLES